jgi:hypothetical protein
LMQMEPTTFLVREKGLDPKAFGVQATRLVCRGHVREQMERPLSQQRHFIQPSVSHHFLCGRYAQ